MEAQLKEIYKKWNYIGSIEHIWILQGDANISYFHTCANGGRRKIKICSLKTKIGTITGQQEICTHIVDFYK
jgi:hypothetical protein